MAKAALTPNQALRQKLAELCINCMEGLHMCSRVDRDYGWTQLHVLEKAAAKIVNLLLNCLNGLKAGARLPQKVRPFNCLEAQGGFPNNQLPCEFFPCSSGLEQETSNPGRAHRNAVLNPCPTGSPGTGPTIYRCS